MTTRIEQDHPPIDNNIRLTREDGTRIQLSAGQIVYTKPAPGGTLVHLASGELLKVVQDARTVDLRVTVALSSPPPRQPTPPHDTPPAQAEQQVSPASSVAHRTEPAALNRRAKHLLLGRSSLPVLMIARASKRSEQK